MVKHLPQRHTARSSYQLVFISNQPNPETYLQAQLVAYIRLPHKCSANGHEQRHFLLPVTMSAGQNRRRPGAPQKSGHDTRHIISQKPSQSAATKIRPLCFACATTVARGVEVEPRARGCLDPVSKIHEVNT